MNIEIDITRRCNLYCNGCDRLCNFNGKNDSEKEFFFNSDSDMTILEVKEILKQLSNFKIDKLSIIGGEPTLNKDVVEICKLVDNADFINIKLLATNHTNEDIVDSIRKTCKNIEIRYDQGVEINKIAKIKNDSHYNILLSPYEEGMELSSVPCGFFYGCGINVHKYDGKIKWFWCSAGTSIAKLLLEENLLKNSIFELLSSYGKMIEIMPKICSNCMYSAKDKIKVKDDNRVSKCFKTAIDMFRIKQSN